MQSHRPTDSVSAREPVDLNVVLQVDPDEAQSWSDEEVASRWLTAFPGSLKHNDSQELAELRMLAITGNPERVAELRKRLGSLSWFMKALNEPIARRANREDNCKGKFWESRYKCQALLEDHAVLSCMAYVDLNPARAAICDTLAESDHTTIQRRLRERERGKKLLDRPLTPVAGLEADTLLDMTESTYIALVQWTSEQARSDKRGKLQPLSEHGTAAPADIWQVANHPKQWIRQVQGTESLYYRAIGSAEALMAKAEELGPAGPEKRLHHRPLASHRNPGHRRRRPTAHRRRPQRRPARRTVRAGPRSRPGRAGGGARRGGDGTGAESARGPGGDQ